MTSRRRRPTANPTLRSKQLAMIHIAATDLGLRSASDDSAYRDMLWSIGRVRSAADLDEAGRTAVLKHLRACGWGSTSTPPTGRYEPGTPAALIRRLWTQLHRAGAVKDRSDRALRRYIATHSATSRGVSEVAPQHLSNAESVQTIEQLKRWLSRVELGSKP